MDLQTELDFRRLDLIVRAMHHQDRLFWGRVQTLYVVQAATIAGSYHIRGTWHGWLLLVVGALLTAVIGIVCSYDWKDRNVNRDRLHSLADRRGVSFGARATGIRRFLRGNLILLLTIVLFVWVDVVVAFIYLWGLILVSLLQVAEAVMSSLALSAIACLLAVWYLAPIATLSLAWTVYLVYYWFQPPQLPT